MPPQQKERVFEIKLEKLDSTFAMAQPQKSHLNNVKMERISEEASMRLRKRYDIEFGDEVVDDLLSQPDEECKSKAPGRAEFPSPGLDDSFLELPEMGLDKRASCEYI